MLAPQRTREAGGIEFDDKSHDAKMREAKWATRQVRDGWRHWPR